MRSNPSVAQATTIATTLLLFAALPTPGAATGSASEDYVGAGAFLAECETFEQPWAACFDVPVGSDKVAVEIDDLAFPDTVGWLVFHDASGDIIDSDFFCSAIEALMPPGTVSIDVVVQDPGVGFLSCVGPNGGVAGTITASFT